MDIAQFKRKSELLLGSLKIDRFIDRTQPTRTTPTTMTRSSKHSGMFMIGPSSAENGRTGPLGQITAVCLDMAPMIDTSPRWGTSPTDLRTTHSDQPDQPDHPDHHFGPSVRSGWSNCHFASILAPQVEHVAGSRMGTQSERHNDPSDDVPLDELVSMFRQAAKNGPCPDAAHITDCDMLFRTTWIRDIIDTEKGVYVEWHGVERAARKALKDLIKKLPPLIELYKSFSNITPSITGQQIIILSTLHENASLAVAAMPPERKQHIALWHVPASLIADDARTAWRKVGRTRFSYKPTGPLVRFTQAFLARAGIERNHDEIAAALKREAAKAQP